MITDPIYISCRTILLLPTQQKKADNKSTRQRKLSQQFPLMFDTIGGAVFVLQMGQMSFKFASLILVSDFSRAFLFRTETYTALSPTHSQEMIDGGSLFHC